MRTRLFEHPIARRLLVFIPISIIAGEAALRIWDGRSSVATGFEQADLIRIGWVVCMVSTVALALLQNRWALFPLAGWIAIEFGSTLFGLYPFGVGWLGWARTGFLIVLGCWFWTTTGPR